MSLRCLVSALAKWSAPVLTLAALGTAASLAEQPIVLPGADAPAMAGDGRRAETLLFYEPRFYDMQERAGLCLSWNGCLPTGGYNGSLVEDWRASDGAYWSKVGGSSGIRFVPDPPGTEYLWRVTVPGLPPVAGYVGTDLGFYYTAYPIQGYDLGMRVKKRTATATTFGVQATMFYADSSSSSSPVLPWANMPNYTSRQMRHTVEYLPGNVLYGKGMETFEVPKGSRNESVSMFWGLNGSPMSPFNVEFDETVPTGPMRIWTWVDGYTTASLIVDNVAPGEILEWDCMLTKSETPNAGPTPGDVMWTNLPWPPSFASRLKALQWSLSGETTELSNLRRHLDLSGDGVQDVADLLMANSSILAPDDQDEEVEVP